MEQLIYKFKNTRKYPIMIKTSVSNGVAKIDIYGIKEENEYEIAIETTILSTSGFKVIYEDNPI
jgi:vancomycin resistance protein YoaR